MIRWVDLKEVGVKRYQLFSELGKPVSTVQQHEDIWAAKSWADNWASSWPDVKIRFDLGEIDDEQEG